MLSVQERFHITSPKHTQQVGLMDPPHKNFKKPLLLLCVLWRDFVIPSRTHSIIQGLFDIKDALKFHNVHV